MQPMPRCSALASLEAGASLIRLYNSAMFIMWALHAKLTEKSALRGLHSVAFKKALSFSSCLAHSESLAIFNQAKLAGSSWRTRVSN